MPSSSSEVTDIAQIERTAEIMRRRIAQELSNVRPGDPQYSDLKKSELRCRRILRNCNEMKQFHAFMN